MWISSPPASESRHYFRMAMAGEQTATPALQSRECFRQHLRPKRPLRARSATSLKDGRGYDGVTNCASAAMISRDLGPGSSVLITGRSKSDVGFMLISPILLESSGHIAACWLMTNGRVPLDGRADELVTGEKIRTLRDRAQFCYAARSHSNNKYSRNSRPRPEVHAAGK